MTETTDGVLAAADRLVEAFSRHDTEAYFAAFAPDASFVFHNLDRILTSREAYRDEWRRWEELDGFRVLGCRSSERYVTITGDVAVFVHRVETDVSVGGESVTNHERETIVFRLEQGRWIAFHEHLSVVPG